MRRLVAVATALLLTLLSAGPVQAQAEPKPPATATDPSEPQPYPLAQVTVRSQETLKELDGMKDALQPTADMQLIEEDLPARSKVIANAAENAKVRLSGEGIAFQALGDLEREWQTRREGLGAWESQITARRSAVDRDIARIGELTARWRLTREKAKTTDATASIETVDRTLEAIRKTDDSAQKRAQQLAHLEAQLGEPLQLVAASQKAVQRAKDARRTLIFVPDAPPLWRAFTGDHDIGSAAGHVEGDLERELQSLLAYFELRGPRLAQLLLFAVITLFGSFVLRRRLDQAAAEDPGPDPAAQLFRRPFSIATLFAASTAAVTLPLAPALLGNLIAILIFVPVLRLLPILMPRSLHSLIWTVVALAMTVQVRSSLSSAPVLSRLLLTAEILAGLVVLVWFVRHARPGGALAAVVPGVLAVTARTLLAFLTVGFLANGVGFVSLAAVLQRGVVISVYAGLVFYAVARIARVGLKLGLQTEGAQQLRIVRNGAARIEHTVGRLVVFVTTAAWLHVALRNFSVRDPFYAGILDLVTARPPLAALHFTLSDLLAFVLVLASAYYLARFVRFVLQEDVFPRFPLQRGIPNAIATTVHYSILLFGLLLALSAAGLELSRITLLAGAFGVGIGFGLQNIVNNFVSGLILLFERPIQVGDTIEVQNLMGDVLRIGPRSSTVRTFDGAEVIVPNGTLISDNVINWTLSDRRRRVVLALSVARGTDPEQVLQILRDVAGANETVLEDPAPLVRFCGYADGALAFELRAWIPRFEEGFGVQTALWTGIERRMLAAGVEIPYPQRDVHLHPAGEPGRTGSRERG